jgi:hypothetical protein
MKPHLVCILRLANMCYFEPIRGTRGSHVFENVEQNMIKLIRYKQRQETGTHFYLYDC